MPDTEHAMFSQYESLLVSKVTVFVSKILSNLPRPDQATRFEAILKIPLIH
jgi:hypothetical protein